MDAISRIELPRPRYQRILVFRALVLGDMLCLIPAMRALRAAYPTAAITLLSLPWAREFAQRFSRYFDDFLEFPGFPGLPERPCDVAAIPGFLRDVQSRQFDLALQMHGSGSFVNPLTVLLGARKTAGFYLPGEYCPDAEMFLPYPEGEHEIWRHLRLLQHLNVPLQGSRLEFPLNRQDHLELRSLPESATLEAGPYVCLHPGARYASRRWPAERYAQVGDALAGDGYIIVLTGAPSERELAEKVSAAMAQPHINLAGRTSLGSLGALVAGARLLVCNDTGVSHVASALQVPSVVVVTGSDITRWAPLDRQRHRLVMSPAECRPCEHRACPIDFHCATGISVEQVLTAAREMLGLAPAEDQSSIAENTACAV